MFSEVRARLPYLLPHEGWEWLEKHKAITAIFLTVITALILLLAVGDFSSSTKWIIGGTGAGALLITALFYHCLRSDKTVVIEKEDSHLWLQKNGFLWHESSSLWMRTYEFVHPRATEVEQQAILTTLNPPEDLEITWSVCDSPTVIDATDSNAVKLSLTLCLKIKQDGSS